MADESSKRKVNFSFDEFSHLDKTRANYFEEISRTEVKQPPPPLPRMKITQDQDSEEGFSIQGSKKSLRTEFSYYNHILGVCVPLMSSYDDITMSRRWATFLLGAEYQTPSLLNKTNKLLLHLSLGALEDRLLRVFQFPPDDSDIPSLNIETIQPTQPIPQPLWESDSFWEDLRGGLPPTRARMVCPIHENCTANLDDQSDTQPVVGALMDKEFKYFLYLARPYGALIKDPGTKSVVALWLQTLASITPCSCLYMKGIRNDYMQALLGYLQDLKPQGLFAVAPPETPLPPLAELAKLYGKAQVSSDVLSREADDFISSQPAPENGAFCYIAASGNLERSNLF